MRNLPDGMAEELLGSTGEAYFQFNAWYDGALTAQELNVTSFSQDYDITRTVIGQTDITVVDELGILNPWSIDDTLGVGGAYIQTLLVVGDQSVVMGFQRLSHVEPSESWHLVNGSFVWLPSATAIPVEAQDVTLVVSGDKFLTQESPASGNTVIQEIQRILDGVTNVTFDPAVVDIAMPSSIVYTLERLDALYSLVGALGAEMRADPTGNLYVYMPSSTPIYTVSGGQEGSLISLKRVMDIGDFPNAVVSTNTTTNGTALFGVATQASGAGYWDGPHGRWPASHQANFAQTQSAINKDAATSLASLQSSETVVVTARIGFDARLEVGDYIELECPTLNEGSTPLPGRVLTITYTGTVAVPSAMDITMACSPNDARRMSIIIQGAQTGGQL